MQRNAIESEQKSSTSPLRRLRVWARNLMERIEARSWRSQMRERDAYLAQAQDLVDLEDRMRRFDRDTLSRGRALS